MKGHTCKLSVAKLLVAFIAILSVTLITSTVTDAAVSPALNNTTETILVGKKCDFNINNKVANSNYTWASSDKSIAQVDKKGVVTGVKEGTATITVNVKTPKKSYTLRAKVTVIKEAKTIQINNKVTALNVGQSYNLNRTLYPSTSNDKTTWKSSDTSIAKPDKNGKFKALKVGTVTITATTLSGAKDTVNINVVDESGTVAAQSELNALLGSGAARITIKTTSKTAFTIDKGDYSKQSIIIDAPNADVTNYGNFKSVEIKSINKWTGTPITADTPITTVTFFDTVLDDITTVEYNSIAIPNGVLNTVKNLLKSDNAESLWSSMEGDFPIGGQTVKITPIAGQANKKTVSVAGGKLSGKSYTVTVTTTSSQTMISIASSVNTVTFIKNAGENNFSINTAFTIANFENSSTTQQIFKLLKSINVDYKGTTYNIDVADYNVIIGYIKNNIQKVKNWEAITSTQYNTFFGQDFIIAPTTEASTKTVTLNTSQKKYTVKMTGSTIIITNESGIVATFTKGTDIIGVRLQ